MVKNNAIARQHQANALRLTIVFIANSPSLKFVNNFIKDNVQTQGRRGVANRKVSDAIVKPSSHPATTPATVKPMSAHIVHRLTPGFTLPTKRLRKRTSPTFRGELQTTFLFRAIMTRTAKRTLPYGDRRTEHGIYCVRPTARSLRGNGEQTAIPRSPAITTGI